MNVHFFTHVHPKKSQVLHIYTVSLEHFLSWDYKGSRSKNSIKVLQINEESERTEMTLLNIFVIGCVFPPLSLSINFYI